MKKYALFFILMIFVFIFSGCADTGKNSIKDSSTGNTVSQVITQLEGEDSTTTKTDESSVEQHPSYLPVENNKEISDQININIGEYFVASGKRLVDMKEVSKEEFIKKYPFAWPEDFETANFYFEIPTELGLKYNEVENGYIRFLGKDRKSILDVYICNTKYVGHGWIGYTNAELKKTYINKTNVIITRNSAGEYRGEFEKNGYYYTFEMSRINEDVVISALKDLAS